MASWEVPKCIHKTSFPTEEDRRRRRDPAKEGKETGDLPAACFSADGKTRRRRGIVFTRGARTDVVACEEKESASGLLKNDASRGWASHCRGAEMTSVNVGGRCPTSRSTRVSLFLTQTQLKVAASRHENSWLSVFTSFQIIISQFVLV